jgi:hypothetical protein
MQQKRKSRVSYVIRQDYSTSLHKRGINSMCLDLESSLLYSAGRDGIINQWKYHISNIKKESNKTSTVKDNNNSNYGNQRKTSLPTIKILNEKKHTLPNRVSFDHSITRTSIDCLDYNKILQYNKSLLVYGD